MKQINLVSLAFYLIGGLLILWHVAHGYSFEHWHGIVGFLLGSMGYGIHVLLGQTQHPTEKQNGT